MKNMKKKKYFFRLSFDSKPTFFFFNHPSINSHNLPHFDVNNVFLTLKMRYLHYLQDDRVC